VALGGSGTPPGATAVAGAIDSNYSDPWRLGSVYFQKITTFLYNSDGDKLCTKLVAFDEIYNIVV
jgi:hypothetical protein